MLSDLLGRSDKPQQDSFARLVKQLRGYTGCRAFIWNKAIAQDPFGTQTFHFKCIVADFGKQAYLGSANFTSASLRSRMELGVLLAGEEALTLWRIAEKVLDIASPCRESPQA